MQTQLGLPVPVNQDEISRKKTLGDAIELCAELAGYSRDKETSTDVGVDKAQLSRWKSGSETERQLRIAIEERDAERSQRLAVEESMRRILTGSKD